jgi:hypothetical protein
MPRPKHGLGQGLEALVGPRHRSGPFPETDVFGHRAADGMATAATQWEFAALLEAPRRRKKRKRTLSLVVCVPDTRVKPRQQRVRGLGLWSALALMGVDGWELVSVRKRCYYFKRAVSA